MLFIYLECKHNIRGITFWSSGTHVYMASLSLLFLLCVSLSFFHSFSFSWVQNGPLLQSASHLMRLTRGHWSPSRPGNKPEYLQGK